MENYNRSRPKMSLTFQVQRLCQLKRSNLSWGSCSWRFPTGSSLVQFPRWGIFKDFEIPLSLLLSNLVSCFRAYVGPIVCDQETTWVSRGVTERPPDKVSDKAAQHWLDLIWLIVHKIIKVGYSLLGGGFDSHNSNVVWHDHCRGLGK